MKINLPPGQEKMVAAIRKLSAEHGRNPTMRELKEFTGARSLNSIFSHLAFLQKKGIVKPRARHAKRAIELTESFAA